MASCVSPTNGGKGGRGGARGDYGGQQRPRQKAPPNMYHHRDENKTKTGADHTNGGAWDGRAAPLPPDKWRVHQELAHLPIRVVPQTAPSVTALFGQKPTRTVDNTMHQQITNILTVMTYLTANTTPTTQHNNITLDTIRYAKTHAQLYCKLRGLVS